MGLLVTLPREQPKREEAFQSLIDQIPVGMVWLNQRGELVSWNRPADAFLTSTAGERIRATLLRLHASCIQSVTVVQASLELSPSEKLHVSIGPERGPELYLAVLDRQKLERARAEANVLRSILKAIAHSVSRRDAARRALEAVYSLFPFRHLAFFELDADGTHFGCAASMGVSEVELAQVQTLPVELHDSLLSVASVHQRVVHVRDLSMAPGPVPFEEKAGLSAVMLPVGGKRQWGVLYASALPEALSEGALGLVQALADALGAVLELSSLEQEATRAREIAAQRDRLATIGQLVAGVAHEINNPLAFLKSNINSLTAYVEELKEQPSAEAWRDVEAIISESTQGVHRIEQLVMALKGTARQRNEKVRFEPSRAVNEAVTIFRGARKAECDIESTVPPLPEVLGSPAGLGQVVLNLLQNGLDAMSTRERRGRRMIISAHSDEKQVVLSFRDHGTGIPTAVQQRMYDAFYTTKDPGKGTGLGLYICHEIVEGMGGRLEFTTSSEGTSFDVILPVAVDELVPRCTP